MKIVNSENYHTFTGKTRMGLERAIDNLFAPDIPIPYRKVSLEVTPKEYKMIMELYRAEFNQIKQNIASIEGALNNLKEIREISIFISTVGTLQIKVI